MMLSCPNCGVDLDLVFAANDADAREFHALILKTPPLLVRPIIRYLSLFRPEKTRLRWSRMVRLLGELLPMIRDGRVTYGHASYTVTYQHWVDALTYLVETPPPTMTLPLKGNGYLLSIIAGSAEKAAATAEAKEITDKRNRADNRQDGARRIGEIRQQRTASQQQTDPEATNG